MMSPTCALPEEFVVPKLCSMIRLSLPLYETKLRRHDAGEKVAVVFSGAGAEPRSGGTD
jgi:hypothetical protein